MKRFLKSEKGFTLLELILVIGILSVISTMVIVAIDPLTQFHKATDAKIKSDLAQVQRALESSYDDNGIYPPSSNDYKIENTITNKTMEWGDNWSPYMNFLPTPPGSSKYIYFSPDGQSYFLYANLEIGSDAKSCGGPCSGAGSYEDAPVTTSACGTGAGLVCNYGVTSPNVGP